jgi:hypothetical protein
VRGLIRIVSTVLATSALATFGAMVAGASSVSLSARALSINEMSAGYPAVRSSQFSGFETMAMAKVTS